MKREKFGNDEGDDVFCNTFPVGEEMKAMAKERKRFGVKITWIEGKDKKLNCGECNRSVVRHFETMEEFSRMWGIQGALDWLGDSKVVRCCCLEWVRDLIEPAAKLKSIADLRESRAKETLDVTEAFRCLGCDLGLRRWEVMSHQCLLPDKDRSVDETKKKDQQAEPLVNQKVCDKKEKPSEQTNKEEAENQKPKQKSKHHPEQQDVGEKIAPKGKDVQSFVLPEFIAEMAQSDRKPKPNPDREHLPKRSFRVGAKSFHLEKLLLVHGDGILLSEKLGRKTFTFPLGLETARWLSWLIRSFVDNEETTWKGSIVEPFRKVTAEFTLKEKGQFLWLSETTLGGRKLRRTLCLPAGDQLFGWEEMEYHLSKLIEVLETKLEKVTKTTASGIEKDEGIPGNRNEIPATLKPVTSTETPADLGKTKGDSKLKTPTCGFACDVGDPHMQRQVSSQQPHSKSFSNFEFDDENGWPPLKAREPLQMGQSWNPKSSGPCFKKRMGRVSKNTLSPQTSTSSLDSFEPLQTYLDRAKAKPAVQSKSKTKLRDSNRSHPRSSKRKSLILRSNEGLEEIVSAEEALNGGDDVNDGMDEVDHDDPSVTSAPPPGFSFNKEVILKNIDNGEVLSSAERVERLIRFGIGLGLDKSALEASRDLLKEIEGRGPSLRLTT